MLREFDEETSKKAIRILEWIACSLRILKTHEVQDGIVLHTMDMELNERTKLRDRKFLHLCKKLNLIEEGPNSTIDFVHYSAKEWVDVCPALTPTKILSDRYILSESSGPFLRYSIAHYHLAFSCMSYLRSIKYFTDCDTTQDALKIRVIKGFHGLHHYANEFWFQHLLQYAKCEDPMKDDELDELVGDISIFWKQDPGLGARSLKLDDTTSAESISNQVQVLADMPQAQRMGVDMLTFRKFLSQEKYSHQSPGSKYVSIFTPSALTRARSESRRIKV